MKSVAMSSPHHPTVFCDTFLFSSSSSSISVPLTHSSLPCPCQVDLSGGVSQKILLRDEKVKDQIESGALWDKLHRFLKYNYLMGASYSDKTATAEEAGQQGILLNHAYSVLMAIEVGLWFVVVKRSFGSVRFGSVRLVLTLFVGLDTTRHNTHHNT